MRALVVVLAIALVAPGAWSWPVAALPLQGAAQRATHVCPMHPDVRAAAPGTCPVCKMALVPIDPLAAPDYTVEVQTLPEAIPAGRPFRLRLTVRDSDTRQVVSAFTEVHEKRFHLFVIGQDLEHYDHVHPDQQPDGSWTLDVTVPRPGYYKLFADFLPEGGTPQVIARHLVTAGFGGDLTASAARLEPDKVFQKPVGTMSVELKLPGAGLVAGRDEKLVYRLSDATTGAPVTDIEPYLGAFGHTLIMSEDTLHFVHAHPVELLPDGAGALGGPELTFKALLPKPGNYRIWTQLKRKGVLSTAMFTISVASPSTQH